MIRKAGPADIDALTALGVEALSIDAYEALVISRERVRAIALHCVSSAHCFAWVAEADGVIGGALVTLVAPNLFYERDCASVLMWYCKIVGDGARLMREFMKWKTGRPAIKLVQYTGERGADPRVGLLAHRLGLTEQLPLYLSTQ